MYANLEIRVHDVRVAENPDVHDSLLNLAVVVHNLNTRLNLSAGRGDDIGKFSYVDRGRSLDIVIRKQPHKPTFDLGDECQPNTTTNKICTF